MLALFAIDVEARPSHGVPEISSRLRGEIIRDLYRRPVWRTRAKRQDGRSRITSPGEGPAEVSGIPGVRWGEARDRCNWHAGLSAVSDVDVSTSIPNKAIAKAYIALIAADPDGVAATLAKQRVPAQAAE